MPAASLFSKRLYTTGVFVLFTVMVIDLMCNALADNTDIRIYFVSFFSAQLVSQVCPMRFACESSFCTDASWLALLILTFLLFKYARFSR